MHEFKLPPLPYDKGALEPFISSKTLDFHYDKHHKTYLDNLNKLIAEETKELDLKEVIIASKQGALKAGDSTYNKKVFNNAAQVWNHTFYWHSMTPPNTNKIEKSSKIYQLLGESFGGVEEFNAKFSENAISQFGSGWAWLVLNIVSGKLEIMQTSNAETPLTNENLRPLLTIDVWEHAYYLDVQNRRAEYVKKFNDNLLNWEFAEKNLRGEKSY